MFYRGSRTHDGDTGARVAKISGLLAPAIVVNAESLIIQRGRHSPCIHPSTQSWQCPVQILVHSRHQASRVS
jgi:hypothetical protein